MLFLQAAEWIYIKTPSRELCELVLTLIYSSDEKNNRQTRELAKHGMSDAGY